MVFILDTAISATFIRANSRHAFYDWICWEYVCGHPQTGSFGREDLQRWSERLKAQEFYSPEEHSMTIPEAQKQYNRIVSRWCFPTRAFMIEVVDYLSQALFIKVFDAANWDNQQGHEHALADTDFYPDGPGRGQIVQELWKTVETRYIDKDAQMWTSAANFGAWWKAMRKDMRSRAERNEKLDPTLVADIFGWRHSGDTETSLCGVFIKHLIAFARAASDQRMENHENGEFYSRFEYLAREHARKLFRPTEFYWYLSDTNRVLHGVNKPPRATKMQPAKRDEVKTLVRVLDASTQGDIHYDQRLFRNGMFFSGYEPGALLQALTFACNEFRDHKLGPFESELFLHKIDFLFHQGGVTRIGPFSKGEVIIEANFDEIQKEVLESRAKQELGAKERFPVVDAWYSEGTEQKKWEAGMMPSDLVAQPEGTKPLGEPEESSSLYLIFIGVGAIAAMLYLS